MDNNGFVKDTPWHDEWGQRTARGMWCIRNVRL